MSSTVQLEILKPQMLSCFVTLSQKPHKETVKKVDMKIHILNHYFWTTLKDWKGQTQIKDGTNLVFNSSLSRRHPMMKQQKLCWKVKNLETRCLRSLRDYLTLISCLNLINSVSKLLGLSVNQANHKVTLYLVSQSVKSHIKWSRHCRLQSLKG